MTIEEHIENLKAIASDMPSDKCADWIESLMAGVKALEQEPCGDCIRREDAINAAIDGADKWDGGCNIERERRIADEINKLPSVSPMPKWIPVSECLPKNKSYVLTTIKIPGRVPHARSGWYQDGVFHNDNGDTWQKEDPEVVGWMYLPEPYKEDAE